MATCINNVVRVATGLKWSESVSGVSSTSSAVLLGATANVSNGLSTSWNPAAGMLNILKAPEKVAIHTDDVEPLTMLNDWEDLTVYLLESSEELLNVMIPFETQGAPKESSPPFLPPGALLTPPAGSNLQSNISELENTLGVPLTPEYSYALGRFRRIDGERSYKLRQHRASRTKVHFRKMRDDIADPEFFQDLKSLPREKGLPLTQQMASLTSVEATSYLCLFKKWGTHFVSHVELGDEIFQVFAYTKENFARIREDCGPSNAILTGPSARSFDQYTTDCEKGTYGYVSEYGKLLCMSNDAAFTNSLSANNWIEPLWSDGQNSIFQALANESQVPFYNFNVKFRTQVPFLVKLTPLSQYCENERAQIWDRLFKSVCATIFLDKIEANFVPLDSREFSAIVPDDQEGVLSTLPTPTVDVYKTRLDLSNLPIIFPEYVNKFNSVAYVTSLGESFNIPGDEASMYAGIVDASTQGNAKVIRLNMNAFNSFQMKCSTFLGCLRIENTESSDSWVISDGLSFSVDLNGCPTVKDDVLVTEVLPEATLSSLKKDFLFALCFGAAVLGTQQTQTDQQKCDLENIVREFLGWVAKVIPPDTPDTQLLTIRARALTLSSYEIDSAMGPLVPILPAFEYEELMNRLMKQLEAVNKQITYITQETKRRKQQEMFIEVAQTLNENIIETGQLLVGFIEVSEQQQEHMTSSYGSAIQGLEAEAKLEKQIVEDLRFKVESLQSDFEKKCDNFVEKLHTLTVINSIFVAIDIAKVMFSIPNKVKSPNNEGNAEVNAFAKNAENIEGIFDLLHETSGMFNSISTIESAMAAIDALNGSPFGNISSLPWEELQIQFERVMGYIPPSIESIRVPKADLISSFEMLTLNARTLCESESQLQYIECAIYENQCQKDFSLEMQQQLEELSASFNVDNVEDLDLRGIDLIGMTSVLNLQRDQILVAISSVFLMQDGALRYQYLQPATMISNYSLFNFLAARSEQEGKTVVAKSLLAASQPATINVPFGVERILASRIADKAYCIRINPSHPTFHGYANTRVKAVVLSVEGVRETRSGNFTVRLRFGDAPFRDVDLNGNEHVFHTPQRERRYEYSCDGVPQFTDNGYSWSNDCSQVTPFGSWHIDFPECDNNVGLTFDSVFISATLTFELETRFLTNRKKHISFQTGVSQTRQSQNSKSQGLPTRGEVMKNLFSSGSVTNGWDVVFGMEVTSVNKAMKLQFEDFLASNSDFNNCIELIETKSTIAEEEEKKINFVDVKYGAPTMEPTGSSTPCMHLPLTQGHLTTENWFGQSGPFNELDIDISSEVLVADVQFIFDEDDTSMLRIDLGSEKTTFDWLNVPVTENGYDFGDSNEISKERMEVLFTEVRNFFAKNNVSFLIPKDAVDGDNSNFDALNSAVLETYNNLCHDGLDTITVNGAIIVPGRVSIKEIQSLVYSYPLLEFIHDETNSVHLTMSIISGTFSMYEKEGDQEPELTGPPMQITGGEICGVASLEGVKGVVENGDIWDVKLILSDGAYEISDLDVADLEGESLSSDEKIEISGTITEYFHSNNTEYLVNKLSSSEADVINDLRPSGFKMRQKVTIGGAQLLNLFIQTGERDLLDNATMQLKLDDPLASGTQCFILIRSNLFLSSILQESFNSDWDLQAVPMNSGSSVESWKGMFKSATLSAYVPPQRERDDIYSFENDTVTWDFGSSLENEALTLTPTERGELDLSGRKRDTVKVTHTWTEVSPTGGSSWEDQEDIDVPVWAEPKGTMTFGINNEGERDQSITAQVQGLDVCIDVEGADACDCNDIDTTIERVVQDSLIPVMKEALERDIKQVSLFAIKNLLFYKNMINLEDAGVPSDVIAFGNFIED